jgi:hypothetical protein
MNSAKKPGPRFRVGDWVSFQYGPRQVSAKVVEDRVRLGVLGQRLYRVQLDEKLGDASAFEVAAPIAVLFDELAGFGEFGLVLEKAGEVDVGEVERQRAARRFPGLFAKGGLAGNRRLGSHRPHHAVLRRLVSGNAPGWYRRLPEGSPAIDDPSDPGTVPWGPTIA